MVLRCGVQHVRKRDVVVCLLGAEELLQPLPNNKYNLLPPPFFPFFHFPFSARRFLDC